MIIEHGDVLSPFGRVQFNVGSYFPARAADANSVAVRYVCGFGAVCRDIGESMIRPGFPVPVGRRLVEIAKTLLAIANSFFCPLSIFDVGTRSVPFNDVSRFVTLWCAANQKTTILTVRATSELSALPAG